MAHKTPGGIPPQAVTAVLVIFVLGWLTSLAAEIFRPDYSAPTGLNECMIALVTAFFVAQQRLTKPDEEDKPDRAAPDNSTSEDRTP